MTTGSSSEYWGILETHWFPCLFWQTITSAAAFSIGRMAKTLNELILLNDNLTGCMTPQIRLLNQGPLPVEVSRMRSLEQLNVRMWSATALLEMCWQKFACYHGCRT